ncbi:MAG: DUF2079 domain-containing protein [Acidobacteriaceae bacterium]
MTTDDIEVRVAPALDPEADAELAEEGVGSLLVPERLQIWVWLLAYTAIMSTVTVFRYHLWLANGWDLGLYQQGLWLIWHQGLLAASTYTGLPILARGGSLVLILFAPLYAAGGVGLLLVAQAFCLGLGYLFVRRIAEFLGVSSPTAHLLGLIYLTFPTVVGLNLADFHPDVLALPVLFGVIWTGLRDRWIWAATLGVVAALVRDTITLPTLVLGAVLILQRHNWSGLAVGAAGVLAYVVDTQFLLPALAHSGPIHLIPGLAIASVPALLAHIATQLRTYEYLGVLLLPIATVVALGWRKALNPWWIPAILVVGFNLLVGTGAATDPFDQFSVTAVPFLLMGTVVAASSLTGRLPKVRRQVVMVIPLILVVVVLYHEKHLAFPPAPPNLAQVELAVAMIPASAPVVTQNFIAPHLANRPIEVLPSSTYHLVLPVGTYVLFDTLYSSDITPRPFLTKLERTLTKQGKLVFNQAGVELIRTTEPGRI